MNLTKIILSICFFLTASASATTGHKHHDKQHKHLKHTNHNHLASPINKGEHHKVRVHWKSHHRQHHEHGEFSRRGFKHSAHGHGLQHFSHRQRQRQTHQIIRHHSDHLILNSAYFLVGRSLSHRIRHSRADNLKKYSPTYTHGFK